jgi:hypothetical protein
VKKLRPLSFGISGNDLPQVRLNVAKIEARLAAADVPVEQHESIVRVLKQACHNYIIERSSDENGITAKQVREYQAEVRKAYSRLNQLLDRQSNPVAKVVLQRAEFDSSIPAGEVNSIKDGLCRVLLAVSKIAGQAGPVSHGGARAIVHKRQLQFAKGFIDTFEANSWPSGMSRNSLMTQLLSLSLDAVGEDYKEPENLLAEAAKLSFKSST